jgi:glutamate racemase
LQDKIEEHLPKGIKVIAQGDIVAKSLVDYLKRHPELEQKLTKTGTREFYTTTDDTAEFDHHASRFFSAPVKSTFVSVTEFSCK